MTRVEDLHYLDTPGRLPAVLCLHGFCQSAAYWAPTLERLARIGVRGLAPDLAGFGASAAAPGPYTMEAYADRLAIWLDTLEVGRIVLVGGSMGGVVAQHLVLRHPHRVERLMLVATGSYTIDPAGATARAEAMARRPWTLETVRPIVNGFFHCPPPGDALERYLRIALAASPEAVVGAARSNALSRTLESLETIAVPTLIMQGRHDRVRTPEHGVEMRDRIRGARLIILDGSGHTPHLEEPEAFHTAALPFLLGTE